MDAIDENKSLAALRKELAELRQSAERLQYILENSHEIIFLVDPRGNFTYHNRVGDGLIGYTAEEMLTKNVVDVVRADHVPALIQRVQALASGNDPGSTDTYPIVCKNGGIVWLEISVCPIVRDGTVVAIQGIARDVTRRRAAEELARIQKDLGMALVGESDLGEAMRLVLAAAMQIEGIDGGGIYLITPTGDSVDLVCHAGLGEEFIRRVEHYGGNDPRLDALRQGSPIYLRNCDPTFCEDARRRENAQAILILPLLHEGQTVGSLNVCSHTDAEISEPVRNALEMIAMQSGAAIARLRAESALRQSEEVTRALLNADTDRALLMETDGRVVACNETAARAFGMAAAEFVGKIMFDLVPADLAAARRKHFAAILRTKRPLRVEETRQGRSLDVHYYPLLDSRGNVARLAVHGRDVTDQRKAQALLQSARHKLLMAREQERSLLARELHDSVGQNMVCLHLAMQRLAVQCTRPQAARIAAVADQCRSLIAEVRQISHGLFPPALESLGLVAAIKQVCRLFQKGEAKCQFVGDDALKTARFAQDVEIALYRIVQEAVSNAARHSKGSLIEVELTHVRGQLSLKVTDDGAGFHPGKAAGKGLGLISMAERVDAIGGQLKIASRPGRTRVEARLPARLRRRRK